VSWAKGMAEQDERIAKRLYEEDRKALEALGDQPLDPTTGEPRPKLGEEEQIVLLMEAADDDQLFARLVMSEAKRLGLSEGLLPRQMWRSMQAVWARIQGIEWETEVSDDGLGV